MIAAEACAVVFPQADEQDMRTAADTLAKAGLSAGTGSEVAAVRPLADMGGSLFYRAPVRVDTAGVGIAGVIGR